MENTYAYLKTVFQDLKKENSKNPALIFIILVLLCIPLRHAFSSISLGILFVGVLFTFKKSNFKAEENLLFPIALFLLMGISLMWTADFSSSLRALTKGVPLLLIPVSFLILPSLTQLQKQKIISFYSLGMVVFSLFYLIKAALRYALTQNSTVFFYHELVTEEVNAIHVSVYVSLAAFYFMTKTVKSVFDKFGIVFLTVFLILLSSKNIIIVFLGLMLFYYLKTYKSSQKFRFIKLGIFIFFIVGIAFTGKIKDRFLIEYQSNVTDHSLNNEIGDSSSKVYNVSAKQAWTQEQFHPNDYFPGTAFRVYQIRIFMEMLQEDSIFFKGYGLNATDFKISEKRRQHNLYEGYEKKNFHNEYVQIFAELGIFGLLILLVMLFINIRNAIKTKDFVHISFAVLMISLFLTESFLSRQRGIVFFTMMYCIYNSGIIVIAKKE